MFSISMAGRDYYDLLSKEERSYLTSIIADLKIERASLDAVELKYVKISKGVDLRKEGKKFKSILKKVEDIVKQNVKNLYENYEKYKKDVKIEEWNNYIQDNKQLFEVERILKEIPIFKVRLNDIQFTTKPNGAVIVKVILKASFINRNGSESITIYYNVDKNGEFQDEDELEFEGTMDKVDRETIIMGFMRTIQFDNEISEFVKQMKKD